MIFALIGNQNSGKTTLFNQLTGSNQHVGNFPGVTVDRKEGAVRGHKDVTVVDLPGIYSLSPYSTEEVLTRDYIMKEHPDGIINIVDASNIERNLYLSLQLISLNLPIVIALNMMDEVRSNGGSIDVKRMSQELGVPVVPISASKNEGVDELAHVAIKMVQTKMVPAGIDNCTGAVHRTIHAIAHMIEDHAQRISISPRFAATKIVEGDPLIMNQLELSQNEKDAIEHLVDELESEVCTDRKAATADMRYTYIEKVVDETVTRPVTNRQRDRSVRIDRLLTNKYLAFPIFIALMGLVFWITFGLVGQFFRDQLGDAIALLGEYTRRGMEDIGMNKVVISMVVDGIFAGVGSVLSFIPTIVLLFFFLSIMEDSGYMARVAFFMDRLLRKIGLSGKSFVPMLIGFGCTVPAVMSARTLSSERDRKMTIFLVPFMSCSAKLPIYGIFAMAFFPKHVALVMISLYLLGMVFAVLTSLLMKASLYKGKPNPFVMELPNYRFPSPKSVVLLLWDKTKDFLTRAFTIIFVASLCIWFLQTFDLHLNLATTSSDSILALLGKLIAPIFEPMGFDDWRISTALVTGFSAKEAVVSTLAVLTGGDAALLQTKLSQMISPTAAYALLLFTMLYTPCVAAIAAVARELKSRAMAVGMVVYQTVLAWGVAVIFYQIASRF